MKLKNPVSGLFAVVVVIFVGLGCKSITDLAQNSAQNTPPPASNSAPTNAAPANAAPANAAPANTTMAKASDIEEPDFTVTSEQLDKEYTGPNASDESLKKYENKNIAVTGRVSTLVKEKKGTVQPWVTLWAPGTLNGVNCYFDDADVAQMDKLTMDKNAKIMGFQDDFIVPKVSPMLKHCKVLEP